MNDFIQTNIEYVTLFISYLIGSIPTAYIVGRLKNIDIRKVGSGNVGATNTARILGKKWALFVLCVDMFKGFFAVLTARSILHNTDAHSGYILMAGMFSVLGHIFPFWLNFKGGKGVATVCGIVIALSPFQAGIAFLIFVITLYLSKFVSLSSLFGAFSLPISYFYFFNFDNHSLIFYFFAALALIIFIMHVKNIKRLLSGTESKISSFAK